MSIDRDIPLGDKLADTPAGSFEDRTGGFPDPQLWGYPATSVTQYQQSNNSLVYYRGTTDELQFNDDFSRTYEHSEVKITTSGHIIEYSDAPGEERVLVKHRSGAGIDLLPDGSMTVSAQGKHILTVAGDQTIIIQGNTTYKVKGDMSFEVDGDFNLSALNFNVNVDQNHNTTVGNAKRTTVDGNHSLTVKENQSTTVLGSVASTIIGNRTDAIKGTLSVFGQDAVTVAAGSNVKLTSQSKVDVSSPSINIAGQSTTVVGASGTFGGDDVVVYGRGATFKQGVTAPSFHGDLTGTANTAITADVTNSQNYAENQTGSASGFTVSSVATPTTALPNTSLMQQYLDVSDKGVIRVSVDAGGEIVKMIDQTQATGGLSKKPLTTDLVREKMRDPANRQNGIFTGGQVGAGTLNPTFARTTPEKIGRISSKQPTVTSGVSYIGPKIIGETTKLFVPAVIPAGKRFAPDLRYVITPDTKITSKTPLAKGITINTFTGKYGLNHISTNTEKQQIARNLQLHAEALFRANNYVRGQLRNFTTAVVEGLYKPGPLETVTTNEIKDLAMQGRAVVYEVINDRVGCQCAGTPYELALYWKDTLLYDKLIIDWDQYNPDGSLNAQVILITPNLDQRYRATYARQVESRYNNAVISNTDLVEVLV